MKYQVIVGNIGTVYDGESPIEANKAWGEYKKQSGTGVGRAAGEIVTLMKNGEPDRQFDPTTETYHPPRRRRPKLAEAASEIGIPPEQVRASIRGEPPPPPWHKDPQTEEEPE